MKTQEQKPNEQKISGNFFGAASNVFRIFARKSSVVLGSTWTFAAAILIIVAWGLSGPRFHYSDTWQLIINTGNDHRNVPDGLSHPKHPKPRREVSPLKT